VGREGNLEQHNIIRVMSKLSPYLWRAVIGAI